MFGEKDVAGVATIHHSLRDVNSRTGDIGLLVQIADFIDWPTVNARAHTQFGMVFQRFGNLHRA